MKLNSKLLYFLMIASLMVFTGCGDDDDDDNNNDNDDINETPIDDNGVTVETLTLTGDNYSGHDGMSIDAQGNLYVSDLSSGNGSTIYRVTPDGTVSVFASGLAGPAGHFFDDGGNLIVSFFNSTNLNQISPDGEVSTFLNNSAFEGGVLAPDPVDGSIYHSVFDSNSVFKISTAQEVTTLASGTPISGPFGIAVDGNQNVYVANFRNGDINVISPAGEVTTLATVPSSVGYLILANNRLYATGFSSHILYEIALDGTITTIAGTGTSGNDDGPGLQATLASPNGIVASADGKTLYISQNDRRIRKVNLP